MSKKVRIIISCLFVVLAFGAGILAYAHTHGDRANLANAVTMPTDYFVDKFGKIVVPPGPVDGSVDTRGTEDNPFFILEIVPYDGMAKVGYMIDGQEPLDVHAMARDEEYVPGESQFYTATSGVRFDFWNDEKPTTDKWQSITPGKTNQYGVMTRVENGMGDYKRVETVDEDGNTVVTYEADFNGNFEWAPLTIEECLALGDDGETEYNEINDPVDTVGDWVKMYFEDVEYVTGYGKTLEHNDVFLRESVGLAYEFDANGVRHAITDEDEINARVDAYKTIVYTVTPEDLNLNLGLIDRADIIFISTQAEMIPSSGDGFSGMYVEAQADGLTDPSTGNVRAKYKYVPYVRKNKFGYEEPSGTYGREYNIPGATFSTNQLSWEAVVKIYENNTSPTSICPIVADFKMYNDTKGDDTETVTFRRLSGNGVKADVSISGTQNNLAKLFMLNYQMTNPVFEAFYGELSAASGMFESVAMANGLTNKDGSAITTGKFNYDKGWTTDQKNGLDQDSKTYWNATTILPWRAMTVATANDLKAVEKYSEAMAPYLIMVDSGSPYDMTSHTNTIRNGFLCFDGDNKVGQTFDSQASGMTDDAYGYEVYDYFDEINGSAARPGTDDLTMADCINYLLGGSHGGPSLDNKVYRVLELEASPEYESEQWFWKPLIAAHTNSIAEPVVETMTTSEFIGSRVDCMGEYDLIYVGVNKFTGNNDPMMNFSGTNAEFSHGISTDYIYAHTGPKVTITTQTYGGGGWGGTTENFKGLYGWLGTTNANQEKYFVYSGNDLTLLAYDKLKEYGAEGFPILFGSGFYSNTGVSAVVSKIDRNSYVYKLGTSASNRFNYDGLTSFTESNKLKDILTINSKKVDFYFASESDYPLLYDDDTTKPDSQRYINGSNINNRELKFTFKVLGPAGTTYRLKLFVDANTDGMYKKGEEDLGVTVRKADNTIASGGVVEAGKTYTVRKTINDRIGSICWKLALVENNADEEKVYASFSGVSAIKDNPSDTTDNVDILVLQIVPDTMTPSLLLPTSKADAESLGGASEMFYDLINVEDTNGDADGSSEKNGINGMKISFVRMTQDEVLAAIIGSGSAAAPEYPNYLKDTYDMLVLGFADRYDGVSDTTVIEKIDDFILAGKAVLYTHDGASVIGETGGVYTPDSKTITETFRDKFGMDRYGALNNVAPENMITEGAAALDVPYIPESGSDTGKVYKTGTKSLVQGLTNGMLWRTYYPEASGDSDRNINTEKVARVNVGAITEYPYNIPETIDVATTHPQVYQLDMEEKDMVVWYTLTNDPNGTEYEKQYYGASPKDVRNNYYIYNKANITYTGMGHDLGAFSMTIDEIKLFVNTFIAAYRAAAKPVDVQVVNDDATVNLEGKQFLCVDVDSSDAANILGNDISDTYRLQVYDSATKKYVEGATVNKKSKRVYFKLISNNSYGSSSTYDVAIKLNDGVELDGVLIKGEIGDPDNTADDSMLAVYEKSTGNFVDGKTVKYQAGDEFIYYVDVPIITEEGDHQRVITTTKAEISATMSYKYSETAEPITTVGHDEVYIMPRGLFDLD